MHNAYYYERGGGQLHFTDSQEGYDNISYLHRRRRDADVRWVSGIYTLRFLYVYWVRFPCVRARGGVALLLLFFSIP